MNTSRVTFRGAAALFAALGVAGCLDASSPAFGTIVLEARTFEGEPVVGARVEALGGLGSSGVRAIKTTDGTGYVRMTVPEERYEVLVYSPGPEFEPERVRLQTRVVDGEGGGQAFFTRVLPARP